MQFTLWPENILPRCVKSHGRSESPFSQIPPGCSLQATSDQRQAASAGPHPTGLGPRGAGIRGRS